MKNVREQNVRTVSGMIEEAMSATSMAGEFARLERVNTYAFAAEVVIEVTDARDDWDNSWYESHTFAINKDVPKSTVLEHMSEKIAQFAYDVEAGYKNKVEALEAVRKLGDIYVRTGFITELEREMCCTMIRRETRRRA